MGFIFPQVESRTFGSKLCNLGRTLGNMPKSSGPFFPQLEMDSKLDVISSVSYLSMGGLPEFRLMSFSDGRCGHIRGPSLARPSMCQNTGRPTTAVETDQHLEVVGPVGLFSKLLHR